MGLSLTGTGKKERLVWIGLGVGVARHLTGLDWTGFECGMVHAYAYNYNYPYDFGFGFSYTTLCHATPPRPAQASPRSLADLSADPLLSAVVVADHPRSLPWAQSPPLYSSARLL